MRVSQFFVSTLKEAPAEAELISHKLMLRAGLIKRLGSGLYTWMPLGLRVLRKIENIIREEMNNSGAMEVLMPAIQPAELWQETGRWDVFGLQMLKIKDRHKHDFCFGPTHEEIITDIVRKEIKSYRQLPLNFYQIQTKFRDEIRPRFGVMRAREFVMKDAYSFHTNEDSLMQTYQLMYETYSRIFTRLGLQFRAVSADTGAIGGSGSHEFHVLADSGEDAIAFCPDSDYAANIELASSPTPPQSPSIPDGNMQKIATPGKRTCAEVAEFLKIPLNKTLKTLAVKTNDRIFLLLLRGDHQLNELKVRKIPFLSEFQLANEEDILDETGTVPGFIGPVGLNTCVIADQAVMNMSNFVCGANEEGFHLMHVNFDRDLKLPEYIFDIRNVVTGDASPDGKGTLEICRGIEVGHIFQLRTKYSKIMKATFLDESGCTQHMEMGCYGIGVSRIVAAAIEQNHDEHGIIFPAAIAPFQLAIIPIGLQKNPQVRDIVEKLYQQFLDARIEVLLDDRDERPGVMFADMELIGIPHRIVIGERGLKQSIIEYQGRKDHSPQAIFIDEIFPFISTKLCID
ncbi:proline--tRNA ligase [Nitrosomonas ureae]|uniref:Proline--tRNA ligase n=1 Tax=Nitrosomonas ureae TaxID=44577 RepID=A0A0S3AK06_9PROT|nr:proline--tRNA ligase [Nitrosomonas ureae]ALQ51500.1 proline--tRNA ligase [Nitrosomonas ureae]PTQ82647.1 prolyl-tRNA synthetase [Nitrosomonas ureae]PXX17217.1 prolyl-tRNA synthetase [Nitrosomonas ureae]SDT98686.1 prolyl-tRNA synthetase [Nitrosomonas ureae]SEQ10855.1 prolyl-tRNA synthetase [Nitrosomonas ureae]